MAKIIHAYNNKELITKLKDRDAIYNSIKDEINGYDYSDEQLKVLNNISKLTQFQKDLLYLSSQESVYDIARDLYKVSPSLLYKELRNIQKILNNK